MMIVMMEVMCFLSRSRWQAFGLWTRFKRRFGLRVGVEERIGSQRYCTRTPFRWCRCRSFRPCACTNCVSAHAAEFVVAAIVISANAACGCGRTIRWILGVVVDHILSCIFCVYLGSKPLHRLKRGGQSLGTGLGTPQFRLQPAIQRLQFRSADGLGLTGFLGRLFVFVHGNSFLRTERTAEVADPRFSFHSSLNGWKTRPYLRFPSGRRCTLQDDIARCARSAARGGLR